MSLVPYRCATRVAAANDPIPPDICTTRFTTDRPRERIIGGLLRRTWRFAAPASVGRWEGRW